jgi:hypothetical protein
MTIKGWAKRYMNTNMKITTTPTQKEQHQQHEKNNNINMTRSTIQCEKNKSTLRPSKITNMIRITTLM